MTLRVATEMPDDPVRETIAVNGGSRLLCSPRVDTIPYATLRPRPAHGGPTDRWRAAPVSPGTAARRGETPAA
jgi:hypothetical protein